MIAFLSFFIMLVSTPALSARGVPFNCKEGVQDTLVVSEGHFFDHLLEVWQSNGKMDLSLAPGKFFVIQKGLWKGKSIHYEALMPFDAATPPKGTFVLLGGLRYDTSRWNRNGFVDALRARGFAVVNVDLPGQGWTLLRELEENGSTLSNLKLPDRFPKEEQESVLSEILAYLKSESKTPGDLYLAGESYGGWFASYLSTLPKYQRMVKATFLFDPGLGDATRLLPGIDQWRDAYSVYRNSMLAFNPFLAPLIPRVPVVESIYERSADLISQSADALGFRVQHDALLKLTMDVSYPSYLKNESVVLYSSAPAMFNGLRNFDAVATAGKNQIPTVLIEAGANGGIVPHARHADYVANLPHSAGWFNVPGAEHDLPVSVGKLLAGFISDFIGHPETTFPAQTRLNLRVPQPVLSGP